MATTLPLLKGSITLSEALAEDEDIIQKLSYPEKRLNFWFHLYQCRSQIEDVVSRHLGISRSDFELGEVEEWIHGSFNACVPIHINASNIRRSKLPRKAIIRFPLPYKIGEEFRRGNVEEKLRCEAATYIWLRNHCPDVPIPSLLGFGFPGTQSFTAPENETTYNQVLWWLRRGIAWMFGNTSPPYIPHRRQGLPDLGYLIIEHVDGRMLSETWKDHRFDPKRRATLFRGLSRVMLSLAKRPLPRIGSWTLDEQGALVLANRPLTLLLHQQENLHIPTEIPRTLTYTSAEPYYLDLIACHDNRLRSQPNSVHDEEDGKAQLAALTGMRALLPKFTDRRLRAGPFALSLTDLHQSNIFVDDDWRVTRIIDLEWACARPLELSGPPHWLSDRSLEELAFHLDEYAKLHEEFLGILEEEEMARYQSLECTRLFRACWESGAYWYSRALDSPSTLPALFTDHIQPRFAKLDSSSRMQANDELAPFWDCGVAQFISRKVGEQHRYSDQLRRMFSAAGSRDEVNDEGRESERSEVDDGHQ
ncbi:hypothetical protein ACRALDRAFT_2131068 [Sodiomyces alcalophilus JCM 7366]|uniref:uncharacterized protein n=1 Tax=Sodiomyces alcalophilus JCM 7366 TaxID=591952 RepID=UPI0039B4B4CE